jgi:hypothetical protein
LAGEAMLRISEERSVSPLFDAVPAGGDFFSIPFFIIVILSVAKDPRHLP